MSYVETHSLRFRESELLMEQQIRETPHKRHYKFIEFYDVRVAETTLKPFERSDIADKRIKIEPS